LPSTAAITCHNTLPGTALSTRHTPGFGKDNHRITVIFISVPVTGTVSEFLPTGAITRKVTITDINDWIYFEDPPYGLLPQTPYIAFYKTDLVLLAQTASPAERVGGGADRDEEEEEKDNAADLVRGSTRGR
jgi:hypothetical protein